MIFWFLTATPFLEIIGLSSQIFSHISINFDRGEAGGWEAGDEEEGGGEEERKEEAHSERWGIGEKEKREAIIWTSGFVLFLRNFHDCW